MGTVSPIVLGAVPVLVSAPVQNRASEQAGTGVAMRAIGFYRGRCSYIGGVWGRYTALGAGWRGMVVGANIEGW